MRADQIALQLYTVREASAADLPGTLRGVAAAGYRFVELAGLTHVSGERLAGLLVDAGLQAIASHEAIERLRDDPDAVAARLETVGCRRIVVPWLPEEERESVDSVRRFAASVGEAARRLSGRGFTLAYHNHDFEFAPLEGTTVWDVLLGELPPEVEIELDVYWASVGGRDPVAEIHANADRVRMLHLKDRSAGPEPHDVPAGLGILPLPAIVEAGRAVGVAWYIAEQDHPADPLADIAIAARHLNALASSPGG